MNITKNDIEIIIEMLEDIEDMCGLKPEERELYEKLIGGNN